MFYLIALLVIGISFCPLVIQELDIWHAQGIFSQGCILLMFSWMVFEKPKQLKKNIPLGLLHLWVGLLTLYICYVAQVRTVYDIKHFFSYFNFLCVLVFYQAIGYLTRKQIVWLLDSLRYVIIITLFMAVLQIFNYSQFFDFLVPPKGEYHLINNLCVGFIGNGTHLSGFLATSIPLFLIEKKRENWLALGLMGIVLFHCGTSLNDPSISGFVIAVCIALFMIKSDWRKVLVFVLVGIAGYMLVEADLPEKFFNTSGRIGIWKYYLGLIKQVSVTGGGLGTMNLVYEKTPFPTARHMHMEYLQYWLEIGLIGVFLIFNLIHQFFSVKANDHVELCLKACVLGFLVSCCFNYPSHLWLPSIWAVFFYGAYMTINERA